jgi:3-oxoacyl-[acyl-carrier-protein] synthase-3
MGLQIQDIECSLPDQVVTNDQLRQENPGWDMALIESKAGVYRRHIARADETALDLATRACERLFERHPEARASLGAVLFCTQSQDYIMPPNACLLHGRLNLPEPVMAFDFTLACSGYVYGLGIAGGLLPVLGRKPILLVNADTYSKYIHKQDRSARVLFGDGAAASLLVDREGCPGIIDLECCTAGKKHDCFIIPAGGCRLPHSEKTVAEVKDASGNVRTAENIHMNGFEIMSFVSNRIPEQVNRLLQRNGLKREDIDLYVFHQASKLALDSLTRLLQLDPARVTQNLANLGNTVSASIPIALKEAIDNGQARRGQKMLLCGFGVGLSWATAIIEF